MELEILHWFETLHNPILNPIMYFITTLGDKGFIWILIALAMFAVLPKRYRKVGFSIVFALILSLIMCNGVMKNLWHRVRPFNTDPTLYSGQLYNIFASIHDWSFPSGHTSASFAAAIAIFMWRKKEGLWAIALATLIALSRLYLTVHYPTDVLASLILGSLYGVISYFIVKWMIGKYQRVHAVFADERPYKVLFKGVEQQK
jgi:undecaprenyl-diphosphatase